jgi:G6PDH family F420-dependent oxidoreductase
MMEGRFFLGVGTGENLNEHVVGQGWPETDVRQERLAEAIEIIRLLWKGGYQSHRGRHFTVENARLYTLPKTPPPIMLAVGGPQSAELAGRLGDGMVGTSPKKETMKKFEAAGGRGKPRYGELTVCWAKDEKTARKTAHQIWPTVAMGSSLSWELALPKHFSTSTPSASTPTPDTTTSACIRWDPTRRASSASTSVRSCRSSARRAGGRRRLRRRA